MICEFRLSREGFYDTTYAMSEEGKYTCAVTLLCDPNAYAQLRSALPKLPENVTADNSYDLGRVYIGDVLPILRIGFAIEIVKMHSEPQGAGLLERLVAAAEKIGESKP